VSPAPTPVPPTPAPPPPTPTPDPYARSITAGQWDYDFIVQSNGCSFGLGPGEHYYASVAYEEATAGDGYISDGERVNVSGNDGSGWQYLGNFLFTYPRFEIRYPVAGTTASGTAVLTNSFASVSHGSATVVEDYGFCTIYAAEGPY